MGTYYGDVQARLQGLLKRKKCSEGWFACWFHVTGVLLTWRWLTWNHRVNSTKPVLWLSLGLFRRRRMKAGITALQNPPGLGSPPSYGSMHRWSGHRQASSWQQWVLSVCTGWERPSSAFDLNKDSLQESLLGEAPAPWYVYLEPRATMHLNLESPKPTTPPGYLLRCLNTAPIQALRRCTHPSV